MSRAKLHSKAGVHTITGVDGSVWRKSDDGPDWVRSDGDNFYVLEKRVRCPEKGVEDTGWYLWEDREPGVQWCATLLLDAVDAATELIENGNNPR